MVVACIRNSYLGLAEIASFVFGFIHTKKGTLGESKISSFCF